MIIFRQASLKAQGANKLLTSKTAEGYEKYRNPFFVCKCATQHITKCFLQKKHIRSCNVNEILAK